MKLAIASLVIATALPVSATTNLDPLQLISDSEQQYQGQMIEFEQERHHGQTHYELTLLLKDKQQLELEYDQTGQLVKMEREHQDHDDRDHSVAANLVVQQYGSTHAMLTQLLDSNAQLRKVEIEQERGRSELELKYQLNGEKIKQKRDLANGEVIQQRWWQ